MTPVPSTAWVQEVFALVEHRLSTAELSRDILRDEHFLVDVDRPQLLAGRYIEVRYRDALTGQAGLLRRDLWCVWRGLDPNFPHVAAEEVVFSVLNFRTVDLVGEQSGRLIRGDRAAS